MNKEPNNVDNEQNTTEWDPSTKVKRKKGEYYKSVDTIEESHNAQSEGSEWVKMTSDEIREYLSFKGHGILSKIFEKKN